MKKVLLFVLAAMFAYTMNAQALFSEGFENGLSAWTVYDSDEDGYEWTVIASYGQNQDVMPHDGSAFVVSQSWRDDALTPDNWMVTNEAITIPATGYVLSWYESGTTFRGEHYAVYISTSSDISAMTTPAAQFDSEDDATGGTWAYKFVNLDAYAGQTVYIAFRHYNCTDNEILAIDDIEISAAQTAPEIQLVSLNLPASVNVNESFYVGGTITNFSSTPLTSFDITYSINGGSNVATSTMSDISVAFGESFSFFHELQASIPSGTGADITVTVSNPNGQADNTEDNTLTGHVLVCGDVIDAPYSYGFEDGLGCWSKTTTNSMVLQYDLYGVDAYYISSYGAARTGDKYFQFCGELFADEGEEWDFNQWCISPELTLSANSNLSFYHASYQGDESIQVMVSTTNNQTSSFTALGSPITVGTAYTEASVELPANTKYVAIKYVSGGYFTMLDDFSITEISTTPEIQLTSITTPGSAVTGSAINVTGVVTNKSAQPLNSFSLTYSLDGAAASTIAVDGLNVAYNETYNFTHTTPATITAGNHTLIVTVSNPNGVADNTADNSDTTTVMGCDPITSLPYTESFDNTDFGCWQNIDADGDGLAWMHATQLFSNVTAQVHSGADALASLSYYSDGTNEMAFNPDNWLISPAINVPATGVYAAKWYAKNYNASYPDSYSVYIATSNTVAALTAAGSVLDDTPDAEYEVKSVMLDNYAGQTIYIAFRHHDSYNNLMLQLDDFSIESVSTTPEIALTEVTAPSQVATNTAYVVNGTVVNNSGAALTSFDVACTADGQTTNRQITGINVPYLQSYSFAVDMPGIATTGAKTVSMTVSNPNGTADVTTDNTQTTSVTIYDASTSVPRTVLMENFSTARCPNCPPAHTLIEEAHTGNYANSVIWTAHHSGFYTDVLTTDLDETMEAFFNDGGATYAPAVMLDRTYWGDASFTDNDPGPVFFPGQTSSNMTAAFDAALAEPAFVTVNISGVNYNSTTRALSLTVSGNVTGSLGTSDARLNVWLLEDGLLADDGTGVGHGPSQSGASGTFYHNHVIRENLSGDDWGEAGVVTGTAGSNYTKTYNTTVSNNYDASKCYIVAFVSNGNHSNINDCRVFNAGKTSYITNDQPQPQGIDDVNANNVKLYPNPTTGNLYIEVEGLRKVEVIDAVGRVVMTQTTGNSINMSNLANGVYTVRVMANGNTAVKKVVKR